MTGPELLGSTWNWNPWVISGCFGACLYYGRLLGRRFHPKSLFFLGGVAVIFLALASPIAFLAQGYMFSAHMLQHLLLVMLAPPLLLLGLPSTGEHGPAVGRDLNWFRNPLLAWFSGLGAMWFWHIPALCDAAVPRGWIHALQTLSLLALGAIFWRPIIGPQTSMRLSPLIGILYLFGACFACSLLGIWISFAPLGVCPAFLHPPADPRGCGRMIRDVWNLTPAADQQIGGLLMWVPACLVYLGAILALLGRYYRSPKINATGSATHLQQRG